MKLALYAKFCELLNNPCLMHFPDSQASARIIALASEFNGIVRFN